MSSAKKQKTATDGKKKVALITGGTSGIGEATAELFVAEGAKVVITGRSEEKGGGIAERLGDNAAYVRADVTQEADIAASIDATLSQFGKLDILFNNAGIVVGGHFIDMSEEQVSRIFDVNLMAVVHGTRAALHRMRAQGFGHIVNTASSAGVSGRTRTRTVMWHVGSDGASIFLQPTCRQTGTLAAHASRGMHENFVADFVGGGARGHRG